jgi:hypothetical protein
MGERTPLPWAICPDEPKWIITTVDGIRDDIICEKTGDAPIDLENWPANAAFIVEACNNFERLKRENEAMRTLLHDVVRHYPVASGLHVDMDGQDGYGPLREARIHLGMKPETGAALSPKESGHEA